jgi:hypothetical protein
LWITLNWEIFDYVEMREELFKKSDAFANQSDRYGRRAVRIPPASVQSVNVTASRAT